MSYGRAFALGVEEELLLVDPVTHLLSHDAVRILAQVDGMKPDLYLALVESATPICADAPEAVAELHGARERARAAGATVIGAGVHPDGPFGEAPHVPDERYREVAAQLRGLSQRTPTCALHVHVGMPDEDAALRAFNGLREHLPLLQALAANSPFWHGQDSQLASARAQMFRGYPRADIPQAFASWDEYDASVDAIRRAGDLPDYTFMWWDLRPHPRLGTIEVRAMDAQSSLRDVLGLAALVHALARQAAEHDAVVPTPREALMESSFRAARDGIAATLWHDGALRPVAEIARTTIAALDGPGLEEIERMVTEGNGAARQRAAFARGGMAELLATLVAEASAAP
ncbi:MAG: glutamate---cysteine ligase / carboxylate-amine ligase [Solirubrobacteraceae bacterium]|nr:glutamate---cysteine ligase / carboxylate-amine ligase [Solirubrobacteraceae bacterium]